MAVNNSFLVTGLGRCGTKFLAQILNTSPTWTVRHESGGSKDAVRSPDERLTRFDAQNYGEVSSYLRFIAPRIENIGIGAVILRNMYDLVLSQENRGRREQSGMMENNRISCYILDYLVENRGWRIIRFERMVSEPEYLSRMCEHLGVTDAQWTAKMQKQRVNRNKEYKYDKLSVKSEKRLNEWLGWFREKYEV